MLHALVFVTLNLASGSSVAATCASPLGGVEFSAPEVLGDGTYWNVDGRLHLFWDRRRDRAHAVTVSWDARGDLSQVEAFLAAVAGRRALTRVHVTESDGLVTEGRLSLTSLARLKRLGVRVVAGRPARSLVRYEVAGPAHGPLTLWAALAHTEESLGFEVAAGRLAEPGFARALGRLVRATLLPAVTEHEARRLVDALALGAKDRVK